MHSFRQFASLLLCLLPASAQALEPKDIFIVVNKNVAESKEIADYYCKKRGVPKEHVIVLDLPKSEDINRKDFDSRLLGPLRKSLKPHQKKAKVLLTVYGVPLRVGRATLTPEAKKRYEKARQSLKAAQAERTKLNDQIAELTKKVEAKNGQATELLETAKKKLKELSTKIRFLQRAQGFLSGSQTVASVDSELSLLWWGKYQLNRWQVNLLNFRAPKEYRKLKPNILMVSRLDGPSVEIAKRLVDDAIAVERGGLKGKVFIDARGIGLNLKKDASGTGYGGYDESLLEMAKVL